MSAQVCLSCKHAAPHNRWGKCIVGGCGCREYDPSIGIEPDPYDETIRPASPPRPPETTMVIRDPETQRPFAVPDEVIAAAERPFRAYELHRAGGSWEDIAKAEHWPNAAAVQSAVKAYLNDGKAIWGDYTRQELRAQQVDRLEYFMSKFAPKATEGNLSAGDLVLKYIKELNKLFTLYGDEAEDIGTAAPVTIVVTDEAYIADLKRAGDTSSSSRNGLHAVPSPETAQ